MRAGDDVDRHQLADTLGGVALDGPRRRVAAVLGKLAPRLWDLARVEKDDSLPGPGQIVAKDSLINLRKYGDDAQKQRYVPRLTSGEAVCGAFALSEPQAGSDPAGLTTRAEKTAGGWLKFRNCRASWPMVFPNGKRSPGPKRPRPVLLMP